MFDFLLDETTNDLVLTDKDLVFTTTTQEELRQRLSIRLLTYKGEWFLNESYGIPYTQEIIGVTRSKKTVDNILLSNAKLELSTSDSISNFESSYGLDTRKYHMSFDVSTIEGVVKVDINSDPSSEYVYPEPTVFNPYAGCGDTIEISNSLFDYVDVSGLPATNPNTGLPNDNTWVNNWQNSLPVDPPLLTTNTPLKSIHSDYGSYIYVITQDGRLYGTGTASYYFPVDNYTITGVDRVLAVGTGGYVFYRKTNGVTAEAHKYYTPNSYTTSVITSSWTNLKQLYTGAAALGLKDDGTCIFTYDPTIFNTDPVNGYWRVDVIQSLLDNIIGVVHISFYYTTGSGSTYILIDIVKSDGTVWTILCQKSSLAGDATIPALQRVGVDVDEILWGPLVGVGKYVSEFYRNVKFIKYQDGTIYSEGHGYGEYSNITSICTPSEPCIKSTVLSFGAYDTAAYVYNGSQAAYQRSSDFISVNKNNIVDMTAIDALYAITNTGGQYKIEQPIIPDGGGYYADYVREQMSTWVF